jgi:FKBP-type peptidyl-prolyl cis-trans isomerase
MDVQVGEGEAPAAGDTVKVVYSAHALDSPSDAVGAGKVFDPYGSAGSSTSKSYKITLGGSASDLPVLKGWELSLLGDSGAGLPPMLPGGRRIVRIPPSLAYGAQGYLCRRGNIAACEVPPNAWVEFDTTLIGRSY